MIENQNIANPKLATGNGTPTIAAGGSTSPTIFQSSMINLHSQSVHSLFEVKVEQIPDAIAVIYGDQRLAYSELNQRANRLASYLCSLGVKTETSVGFCLQPSVEMVIAMLAILKAGGAYVPLDPTYPEERLGTIIDDAGVNVIVTQRAVLEARCSKIESGDSRIKAICLDTDWHEIAQRSDTNPNSESTSDNLAYIMYTSGSTGKPKGVAIPHRAITRLVIGTNYVQLDATDRIAQVSNCAFDAATFEIWGALLNGACLIGIDNEIVLSPKEFAMKLRRCDISTLFLTTALFNQIARETPDAFKSFRQVLFGGEAVEPKWVSRVLEHGPPQRLLHVYGPTENTTFTTWHWVNEVSAEATTIPIGRSISKTQTLLLDPNAQLVPIGVEGELYTGGGGLARGYLNDPAFTAERFMPNPFSKKSGARLYKTGDLCRYHSNGNIEFIGRRDHQVKIRGFRIELGEIETALRQHPKIEDAIVSIQNEKDLQRIVAYVILAQQAKPSLRKLRDDLKQKLPSYMLPSAFVFIKEFPLNANGKVDRAALERYASLPEQMQSEGNGKFAKAKDTLEIQLTKIWERLLKARAVSIKDNFFDLGGHSLLAVHLFDQIEKAVEVSLPISTLFQAPTIEELAEMIRAKGWSPLWSSLVPIQPEGAKMPFFCIHAGGANVLFYRDLALQLGPDQPVYGIQPQGMDGKRPELRRIEDMAAHYIKEIQSIQPEGPYCMGGSSMGGTIAFEMARQLHAQGEKVGLVALFDTHGYGYPRYPPSTTRFRRVLYFNLRRVEHHFGSLRLLANEKRLAYLKDKTDQARYVSRKLILKKKKEIAGKLYHISGQPLPQKLRLSQNALLEAIGKYVPQAYAGRVTLFRASKQPLGIHPDPALGWGGLAAGGLEIHEVLGQHGSIVVEPRVRFLAEKLKRCLEKVEFQNVW